MTNKEQIYRKVKIKAGSGGWGGPIIVEPKPGRDRIYSVVGGGIHPVAQRIAELTGGVLVDGLNERCELSHIAVAVVDCGGTARIGVYPMKKIPTVDVYGARPSSPLTRFVTPDLFVSGVSPGDIELIDG